jgi:hypothetical protein
MKKQAEEAARLAREEGGGNQDGVQLLRSNAELDGAISTFFPSSEFLCAQTSVVRRSTLAVASNLGCMFKN